MSLKYLVFLFGMFCLSAILQAQSCRDSFSYKAPADLSRLKKLDVWATQYFIHQFTSSGTIPILDENGHSTGLFADTCNFCAAALEGTAFISDSSGRIFVLNFAGRWHDTLVNCRLCKSYSNSTLQVEDWGRALWTFSSGFGLGVKGYQLQPYRTIAVDNNFLPYGSVVFVPALKGQIIELPDGKKVVHDGYLFAGDTGGAIKGTHIDIFTGICKENPFPGIVQSIPSATFEIYLVTDPTILASLMQLHAK